jgi:hypothetical protein
MKATAGDRDYNRQLQLLWVEGSPVSAFGGALGLLPGHSEAAELHR